MSLIESALEKVRRNAGLPAAPADASARAAASGSPSTPEAEPKHVAIDWTAVRAAGYLPAEDQSRRFADHYRQIKRPLIEKALAANSPADMRLILISSAIPGDGKTFTAVNLALSMARERDISLLLVDADVPRAQASRVFGLSSAPGLMDALANESLDAESLIVRTDVRGLDILPAGRSVENATELLASTRMAQIAARMAQRNPRRLVLLDSSPLLASSEARALVRIPGQIVLVVRAGQTPRQAVLDALGHVDPKKLQGLVLNQAPVRRGDGYYYGHSNYGSAEQSSGVEPR